jgi:hypothetical protein
MSRGLIFTLVLILAAPFPARPAADKASVFSFAANPPPPLDKLADDAVAGHRVPTAGSQLSMSVESYYLVPLPMDRVLAKMRDNQSAAAAEGSKTLKINGHHGVNRPASEKDFATFTLAGACNSILGFGGSSMAQLELKHLNLSRKEIDTLQSFREKDPEALTSAWRQVLARRALSYQEGGLLAAAPYETMDPPFKIQPALVLLLKDTPKVLSSFQDLIGVAMTGNNLPHADPPVFYWEGSQLQGDQTVTLGSLFSAPHPAGHQVLECTYYVSGSYFTSLILYQLHPVTVNGSQQTLVWRGDYVISRSLNFLKGIERVAAENIMLLEIKKSVGAFLDECRKSP